MNGLKKGHAYSLLDVKDLHNSDGTVAHTLAQVRIPWSSERFTGKWSDSDSRWTDAWKKEVNLNSVNDGKFWMDFDEYLSLFYATGVAFDQPFEHHDIYEKKIGAVDSVFALMDNPVDQDLYM